MPAEEIESITIALLRNIIKEVQTMTGYVGPIEKATLSNSFFRQVLLPGS